MVLCLKIRFKSLHFKVYLFIYLLMLLAGTHQEKWFYWKQAEHQAGAILLPSGELLLAVPLSKTPPSSSSSPGRKAPTTPGAVPSVRAPPSILLRKRRR